MNLLIVDDEFYSVEGLYVSIDWPSLGIDSVYKAYSMQQAQDFFHLHSIDVLISDIEMPKGSGLDLLKWIRDNNFSTVTIFLTSYANFDYASNAIKLQSSDYLLKPVDTDKLKECIVSAVKKVKQTEIYNTYKINARYWDNTKKIIEEQFWSNLCNQIIPENTAQILRELKQYHLHPSLLDEIFYTGLLEAYMRPSEGQWEINLFEYAIRNIITEIFNACQIEFVFTRLKEQHYFICINIKYITERSVFMKLCHEILRSLHSSLPGVFQLFAGDKASLLDIGRSCQEIIKIARNNLNEDCQLIDTTSLPHEKTSQKIASMDEWADMLAKHKKLEVMELAMRYLSELKQSRTANRSDLLRFYHDFMQIIYSILEKNGEAAHRLFSGSTSEEIFEQACNSIGNMKIWLTHVINTLDECLITISQTDSTVEIVKKYIREHISEELTRKTLAAIVYLSPDYLSHVFSESTRESLSTFILNERIKKSKELLLYSRMNIRDIALMTGFSNISYFSRQFKNITGMTPQEFRKK